MNNDQVIINKNKNKKLKLISLKAIPTKSMIKIKKIKTCTVCEEKEPFQH